MNDIEVRIEKLEPFHYISAYGFGDSPEGIAHEKMTTFLAEVGLLEGYGSQTRHFGFNNPDPSPGSPNYGYEIWVVVDPSLEPRGDLKKGYFPGGLYAVTRFTNLEKIGQVWQSLVAWREFNGYQHGTHQWLENLHNPLEKDITKFTFDLYLPIRK